MTIPRFAAAHGLIRHFGFELGGENPFLMVPNAGGDKLQEFIDFKGALGIDVFKAGGVFDFETEEARESGLAHKCFSSLSLADRTSFLFKNNYTKVQFAIVPAYCINKRLRSFELNARRFRDPLWFLDLELPFRDFYTESPYVAVAQELTYCPNGNDFSRPDKLGLVALQGEFHECYDFIVDSLTKVLVPREVQEAVPYLDQKYGSKSYTRHLSNFTQNFLRDLSATVGVGKLLLEYPDTRVEATPTVLIMAELCHVYEQTYDTSLVPFKVGYLKDGEFNAVARIGYARVELIEVQ